MTKYEEFIYQKSNARFLIGIITRVWLYLVFEHRRRKARRRGATIGKNVILSRKIARTANHNLFIGDNSSLVSEKISLDMRLPLRIGSNVIVGHEVEIITVSHNIDSKDFERKNYGVTIEDYAWICPHSVILPSCTRVGKGAVVGTGSVVVKRVDDMQVVSGNPAGLLRMRLMLPENLVVESLNGGDLLTYIATRKRLNSIRYGRESK